MKKIFAIISALFLVVACKKKDVSTIKTDGINLSESTFIDTFSVKMSTVLDDYNVRPDNLKFHTVGSFVDPYFGVSTSTVFIRLEDKDVFNSSDNIDSAFIEFNYEFFVQGDTSKVLDLEFFQTSEELSQDSSYSQNSSLALNASPFGSISVSPTPLASNIVKVRVSQEWINEYQQNDVNNTFDGSALCIKVKEGVNASIVSFEEDELELIVYGSSTEGESFAKTINLSSIYDFDQYSFDRSSTNISALVSRGDEVPSALNNNRALLQSGTGVSTKIELNSVKEFLQQNPSIQIDKAELIIHADENTVSSINGVAPELLVMYVADNNVRSRDVNGDLTKRIYSDDHLLGGFSNPFFTFDESNLTYELPITNYLRDALASQEEIEELIISANYGLYDVDEDGKFQRDSETYQVTNSVVLYGEGASVDKAPKLEIYFTEIK